MRIPRIALVVGAALLAACGGDKGVGPKPGDNTTTELTCGANSSQTKCTIPIAGKSSFTITVESIGCEARGNILRVVSPTAETLSEDACTLAPGKSWTFTAPNNQPFSAAAALNLNVTARSFNSPPSLQLSTVEAGKRWRVVFEDGYDTDFNDVILTITAN